MIVGTAGHIDHGKTSLVRALTGVDTDRLKEEKARGISIDLGFAYMPARDGSVIGFVDVPGHEKFIHNMLAGATGIDLVLLVVAADDGIMPQTREHLAIVDLLGISRGVVALTKSDLAEGGRANQVVTETETLLQETSLAGSPIVRVSTVTGEGVEELRNRLFGATQAFAVRAVEGHFRLAVDRCFSLQGTGTVVTGTVLSGAVSVGDQVAISPSGVSARVRSIHAQNRATERGVAGQRCAINLAGEGISKESIARGDVVLDPASHAPAHRIDAILRVLPSEQRPLAQWMPVRLHHAATEIGARVVRLSDEGIRAGAQGYVQLVLDRPIAAAAGDRFVLRDTSARRTIGGGRFLDLRAPARKRRSPERLAQLEAHALSDFETALSALLDRSPFYLDLAAFARDRLIPRATVDAIVSKNGLVRLQTPNMVLAVSPQTWSTLKSSLIAALETFHSENPDSAGIGAERLRLQLEPRLPAPAFAVLLQALQRTGDIALDAASVQLPSHEVRLTPRDEAMWAKIRPLIGDAERFRPPRIGDVARVIAAPEGEVRRLFKLLSRLGRVDEIAGDHFFLRDAVADMARIAADLSDAAPGNQFTAAQFRDRLDNGRKVAIQILEFFDRRGVTSRRGDLRRINKQRLDLFRRSDGESSESPPADSGRVTSPVGRPDFKSGKGRKPVLGGFDSHSLPPNPRKSVR